MANNYAGTATYPANVRTPSDDEYGNATVLDRPLEDLADRTAFLKAGLPINSSLALPADLAEVDVSIPLRHVRGFGWYQYESTFSGSADNPPWYYMATAGGMWVHSAWQTLTGLITRTQLAPAIVPQALSAWGSTQFSSPWTHTFAGATPEVALTPGPTISGLMPGDTLSLEVGPIAVGATSTAVSWFPVLTTEFGTTTLSTVEVSAGSTAHNYHNYDYVCQADDATCAVTIWGFGNGTVSGATGTQWLRWKVLRPTANL